MAPRAVIDACALYPPLVRGALLSAAAEGLLAPVWSARILEEWARASLRDHGPEGAAAARAEAAAMRARWPEAEAPDAEPEGLDLPDPADRHVLGAALAAQADWLVTFNLRDFPGPKLRALGVAPIAPDAALWELAGREGPAMGRALERALAPFPRLGGDAAAAARALKRVGLPRLAKLVRTGGVRIEA